MAAPTTVLTIVKRFTYRADSSEEWSNTYMLTGSTPADSTAWRALFDAMVVLEKPLFTTSTSVVRGYGYDSVPGPGDSAVWTVDMTVSPNTPVAGTRTIAGGRMAGDQAAWVRWGLDRFNTKGKRVYVRKYFHDGDLDPSLPDNLNNAYKTALTTFGGKLDDGTLLGSRKITDKLGTATVGHAVSPYTTTRTLKRRGKRPPT